MPFPYAGVVSASKNSYSWAFSRLNTTEQYRVHASDASDNLYVTLDNPNSTSTVMGRVSKLNPVGIPIWTVSYSDTVGGQIQLVKLTSDGYLYILGWKNFTYPFILRVNPTTGAIISQYQFQFYGFINDLDTDASGNLYCTINVNNTNGVLLKLNSSFTTLWQVAISGTFFNKIKVTSSGNCYLSGGPSGVSAWVAKYNSSGTAQWQRQLTGPNSLNITGFDIDSSENVYFAATDYKPAGGYLSKEYVGKYNSSGVLQFVTTFTNLFVSGVSTKNLVLDNASNIYCLTFSSSGNVSEYVITKLNSSGVFQWSSSIFNATLNTSGTLAGILYTPSGLVFSTLWALFKVPLDNSKATGTSIPLNITQSFSYAPLTNATATATYTESAASLTTVSDTAPLASVSTYSYTTGITFSYDKTNL